MPTVAIVGAGSIGVAFAIVFARAGFAVRVQDPDAEPRAAAPEEIAARLEGLVGFGLVLQAAPAILGRIAFTADLAQAVANADHVQECAPERLELKRRLFVELDRLAPPSAVLASSSSAIQASAFAGALSGRARCLVAHPGNPPYLLSVVEIMPSPFTGPEAISRAERIFEGAGLAPVRVRKEVEGFVFNRLQGALLREAYCLVRDGVASVEDIDRIVRHGLGLRWSVVGPFETADLNTRGGIASHAEKLGPAYARMGAERGQDDPWTPELVSKVERSRTDRHPWQGPGPWRRSRPTAPAAAPAPAPTHRAGAGSAALGIPSVRRAREGRARPAAGRPRLRSRSGGRPSQPAAPCPGPTRS